MMQTTLPTNRRTITCHHLDPEYVITPIFEHDISAYEDIMSEDRLLLVVPQYCMDEDSKYPVPFHWHITFNDSESLQQVMNKEFSIRGRSLLDEMLERFFSIMEIKEQLELGIIHYLTVTEPAYEIDGLAIFQQYTIYPNGN